MKNISYTSLYRAINSLSAVIDEDILGKNIFKCMEKNVESIPNVPAIYSGSDTNYTSWKSISWRQYYYNSIEIASALLEIGVENKDTILIISRNRVEHNIVDMGILYSGSVPSSIYPTLKSKQILDIAEIAIPPVIFVDTPEMLDEVMLIKNNIPSLNKIITFEKSHKYDDEMIIHYDEFIKMGKDNLEKNKASISQVITECKPSDNACILFTSGTTGIPKGVQISHANIIWTIESYLNVTGIVSPSPRMISYLPLAHITERIAHHYHIILRQGSIYCAYEMVDLKKILPFAKPTLFFAVPRVWEKLHAALLDKIKSSGKEHLVMKAINNGILKTDYEQSNKKVPWSILIKHKIFSYLIFSKMKAKLGLDKAEIYGSGAAPLNPDIQRFFHAINIPITEVYGLTENTAPALSSLPNDRTSSYKLLISKYNGKLPTNTNIIGSCGYPIPGTAIKIAEDGELLLKGNHVFKGYFKDREATNDAFTPDGWFKTGDIAKIDDNGSAHIIARKKELIVTSGGKNIAPVEIENYIKNKSLIGQVCVVGDNHHYISAIITLNHEGSCLSWAKENGFDNMPISELIKQKETIEAVSKIIDHANSLLSRVQQIKRFTLVADNWSSETGELTPTLKLKRFFIVDKYAEEIEKMYHQSSNKAA